MKRIMSDTIIYYSIDVSTYVHTYSSIIIVIVCGTTIVLGTAGGPWCVVSLVLCLADVVVLSFLGFLSALVLL